MFEFLLGPWPLLGLPILVLGFLPLVKGADLLVDGSASLAHRFGIPVLVIGLTLVAFGTSAPELVVNLFAAVGGNTDIALGNIVGSNISNILLILGVSALFSTISIQKSTRTVEIPLVILIGAVLWAMGNDRLLDGGVADVLNRIDGSMLLVLFLFFLYYNVDMARKGMEAEIPFESEEVNEHIKPLGIGVSVAYILIGLAGLFLGGKMVVEGAVTVARSFGLSERVIGLTIVSIGTSLPELVTSVVAAVKKQADIAVGNIVGSNIFNVLFILGLTAVIAPVPVSVGSQPDLILNIVVSVLLLVFVWLGRSTIRRWQGSLFVLSYIAYIVYLYGFTQNA